jgi:putative transposase
MPDKRSVGPPDWLLVLNRRHLEHVLHTYVQPYNRERPHRALNLLPPETTSHSQQAASRPRVSTHHRDRLGGLIHEYYQAAA